MKNANPVSLALLAGCLAIAGCSDRKPAAAGASGAAAAAAPKTIGDWFDVGVGNRTVRLQLAVREPEMERGLMGRRDLGRDEGMLFAYKSPQKVAFWMKDTPTALDIAYFNANGALAEVYPAFPFDEKNLPSRSEDVQWVLEMNQGWYAQNGVRPGDKIDLNAVATALKARGFDPAIYGIK